MWSWLHLMAWPSPFCVMPAERADHKTARVIAQFCSGSTRTELVECHRGGVRDVEARQGRPGRQSREIIAALTQQAAQPARGSCPYCPSSTVATGQIALFPHSRPSASLTLMLFAIDSAGRVEPTIGPSSLPSMYSITGASTFQPP